MEFSEILLEITKKCLLPKISVFGRIDSIQSRGTWSSFAHMTYQNRDAHARMMLLMMP